MGIHFPTIPYIQWGNFVPINPYPHSRLKVEAQHAGTKIKYKTEIMCYWLGASSMFMARLPKRKGLLQEGNKWHIPGTTRNPFYLPSFTAFALESGRIMAYQSEFRIK
ncbi:hypothetical protein VNO78_21016 [Psophocarpus tetragonolobus]|uniref:Uncharacterized protein n=1 Tax=Psophocarpus tetragonolobus TaxID=3891 RepID=A0AAN9XI06_PSOTE